MLNAVLSGELERVPMTPDPVFRVLVPQSCPNVPASVLDARGMWQDKAAYDRAAAALSARFRTNFEKFTAVEAEVREAAPVA
jgi:phosphoenolpyruvate carboxykinase (ATP)